MTQKAHNPMILNFIEKSFSGAENNTQSRWLYRAIFCMAGIALLWISAKVKINFWPVPMTMQPLVVLLIGLTYGRSLGLSAIGGYLMLGAVGMPVFTNTPEAGIGYLYMMGPTGGYLLGFMLVAVILPHLAEKGYDRSIVMTLLSLLIGLALIYIPGVLWLGTLIGWDKPVMLYGFWNFILADLVKIAIAGLLIPPVRSFLESK